MAADMLHGLSIPDRALEVMIWASNHLDVPVRAVGLGLAMVDLAMGAADRDVAAGGRGLPTQNIAPVLVATKKSPPPSPRLLGVGRRAFLFSFCRLFGLSVAACVANDR